MYIIVPNQCAIDSLVFVSECSRKSFINEIKSFSITFRQLECICTLMYLPFDLLTASATSVTTIPHSMEIVIFIVEDIRKSLLL